MSNATSDGDLVTLGPALLVDTLGDDCVVYSRWLKQTVIVPSRHWEVVTKCRSARTLDDHVAGITAVCDASPAAIRSALSELMTIGLLRRISVVKKGPTPTEAEPRRRAVAIATADRPQFLRRMLESLAPHIGNTPIRVVIVDGSRTTAAANASRSIAREAITDTMQIEYLGRPEAERLQADLSGLGFDPNVLKFGLTPGQIGASRNLLLLVCPATDLIMIDDDILCNAWGDPKNQNIAAACGHAEYRSVEFHETRTSAVAGLQRLDASILDVHLSVLGSPLSDVCRRYGSIDFSAACAHQLEAVGDGRRGTVLLTMAGLAGDSAVRSPYRALFSVSELARRLAEDEAALRTALRSREVRRLAGSLTISHDLAFMAYCSGVSNHGALPPFPPIGTNEDGVFGQMTSLLEPSALLAHLPVGIVHDSSRHSEYADANEIAVQVRFCDVVEAVFRTCRSCVRGDWASRINVVAASLAGAGSLSPNDIGDFVATSTIDMWTARLAASTAHARHQRVSTAWLEAVNSCRRAFVSQATSDRFAVPIEYRHVSIDEAWTGVARDLRLFARLVQAWPDLYRVASQQQWSFAQ